MSTQVPTNSIEIVGDEIPGKVRLTMRSADGEWMTTHLDAGEVAAIHAALSAFVPDPEVRGYVVLTHPLQNGGGWATDGSGTLPSAAGTDALVGRLRAAGYPEAAVGVVTALPAEAES